jgi:ribosomal protein L3 glutamine methyltransferase
MTLQELLAGPSPAGGRQPGLRPRHHQRPRRGRLAGALALGLPLDSDLDEMAEHGAHRRTGSRGRGLISRRIDTRQPAAYLTREAWLQGVPFYVDERAIVPRSFIAELIADGGFDAWLGEGTRQVLDLCTGNGSLAVLAAMAWPEVQVTGADISPDALAVARINVDRHGLQDRITLIESDGLAACPGPGTWCCATRPTSTPHSMAALPPSTAPSPRWRWPVAPTAWTSCAPAARPAPT